MSAFQKRRTVEDKKHYHRQCILSYQKELAQEKQFSKRKILELRIKTHQMHLKELE